MFFWPPTHTDPKEPQITSLIFHEAPVSGACVSVSVGGKKIVVMPRVVD